MRDGKERREGEMQSRLLYEKRTHTYLHTYIFKKRKII